MKPLHIVIGDSRVRYIKQFEIPFDDGVSYQTVYYWKSGARIADLDCFIPDIIQTFGRNRELLITLCCGINNITKRITNGNGEKEVIRDTSLRHETDSIANKIWAQLESLRDRYSEEFQNSVVTISTIAPINLPRYSEFQISVGKLSESDYTEDELTEQSLNILDDLVEINKRIKAENGDKKTVFFHSNCVVHKRQKWRFLPSALYDGLHITDQTALTWYNRLHQCAAHNIRLF